MIVARSRRIFSNAAPGALAIGLLLTGAALAQTAPNAQPDAPAATEPTAPPPEVQRRPAPGLFGAIGQWMDESLGRMTSGWNNARGSVAGFGDRASEAAKDAADAARDAAATVVRMPPTAIVTGRGHCVGTLSGGPDCQAATDALCRSKGYSSGTSLHIQSEQKCPVWGWVKGDKPIGKCGTETYVTSAMCR